MSFALTTTLPDGYIVRLGNNPPDENKVKLKLPLYGSVPSAPLIPETEWKRLIDLMGNDFNHPHLPYVHDQDGIGQCNCDAGAAAIESERIAQGLPPVVLSAADLYDRINGGRDDGSTLEDALSELMSNGIGTKEDCGTTLWTRGFKRATSEQRAKYKITKAFLCPDVNHIISAVLSGFKLVSGIWWYDSYSSPGSDGWLPNPRGGRGGHAVFGYKANYRMIGNQIQYGVVHQNSWRPTWGINGRCVFPTTVYQQGGIGGWYAVKGVTDEGGIVPTPAA